MRASVEELFHQLADLSVEARAGYFDKHGIDGMTRSEVEALMAFDLRSTDSLEKDIGLDKLRSERWSGSSRKTCAAALTG